MGAWGGRASRSGQGGLHLSPVPRPRCPRRRRLRCLRRPARPPRRPRPHSLLSSRSFLRPVRRSSSRSPPGRSAPFSTPAKSPPNRVQFFRPNSRVLFILSYRVCVALVSPLLMSRRRRQRAHHVRYLGADNSLDSCTIAPRLNRLPQRLDYTLIPAPLGEYPTSHCTPATAYLSCASRHRPYPAHC